MQFFLHILVFVNYGNASLQVGVVELLAHLLLLLCNNVVDVGEGSIPDGLHLELLRIFYRTVPDVILKVSLNLLEDPVVVFDQL